MNSQKIFYLILGFFIYLIVQVLLLKNMVIFGMIFCFLYVLYLLLLPLEMKIVTMLLISFVLGISVDIFYDTMGIHTASLLVIGFIREQWIKLLTPTGGYDEDLQPTFLNMGFGWFLTYSLPLFFIHHFIFFSIESWGTDLFIPVIQKTASSAIFVFIISIIVQLLFYRRRRGV
ncbi:rod shape-determining protein MreD [Mongoliitalea daihaiensis]|uniref:rod shape-determining protein MreD n=1 Tax=Mongoliitalea daihaiensis TaxID=2782006 RepID=UPI001F19C2B8|nr:rod shape-determining protein MreD [Mongoliitalea daihaiensis]UJP66066.1 rod shape-determining protein MreD [Mongoliitalea daihaiensis]